jgi:uncharacterized protein (DUF433 family)
MNWEERIESNPSVLRGKPCVKGTRIPVALVLGHLASGLDVAGVIHELPGLVPDDIAACLDYARELADHEVAAPA